MVQKTKINGLDDGVLSLRFCFSWRMAASSALSLSRLLKRFSIGELLCAQCARTNSRHAWLRYWRARSARAARERDWEDFSAKVCLCACDDATAHFELEELGGNGTLRSHSIHATFYDELTG